MRVLNLKLIAEHSHATASCTFNITMKWPHNIHFMPSLYFQYCLK